MKNLLYLAESEKKRILGLHKNARLNESKLITEQNNIIQLYDRD